MHKQLIRAAITIAAIALPATASFAYSNPPASKTPPSTGSSSGGSQGPSGSPSSVPEPAEFALFGLGLAGLAVGRLLAKRRKSKDGQA